MIRGERSAVTIYEDSSALRRWIGTFAEVDFLVSRYELCFLKFYCMPLRRVRLHDILSTTTDLIWNLSVTIADCIQIKMRKKKEKQPF